MPSLAANIGENSVLFAAYGGCQKMVTYLYLHPALQVAAATGVPRVEELGIVANGVSGFLAAFWSSLVLCPTELVKCRLQVLQLSIDPSSMLVVIPSMANTRQAMRESGSLEGRVGPGALTRRILREDGLPGLFRGLTATFTREMPGYFFFFLAYEATRQLLTPPGKSKDEIGPLRTVVAGGVAGVTLWTIIFPADVVKSRLQVAPHLLAHLSSSSSW